MPRKTTSRAPQGASSRALHATSTRPSAVAAGCPRSPTSSVQNESVKSTRAVAELFAQARPSFVKKRAAVSPVGAADRAEIDEFNAWMAKYGPVERAIIEARERRLAKKAERRAERPWIFGTLCELTGGAAKAWRNQGLSLDEQIKLAEGDTTVISFLISYYGRSMTRKIDQMRHALKRPIYYEAENARRRCLAVQRRTVRRRTTRNPCPTKMQILEAWLHLKDSHEDTIRFGSLIEDLACYVDSSLRFDDAGNICGRRGGVKAWLQENVPALALRYTTVMRYKALARKLKQITEINDPTPADAIVGRTASDETEGSVAGRVASDDAQAASGAANREIMLRTKSSDCADAVVDRTAGGETQAEGADENREIMLRTKTGCGEEDAFMRVDAGGARDDGFLRMDAGEMGESGASRETRELSLAKEVGELSEVHEAGELSEVHEAGELREVQGEGTEQIVPVEIVRARAIWMEIVTGIKANPTALVARINGLVDPERVEDATMLKAWREKYAREITPRTKEKWWKRLMKGRGVA